MISSDDPRSEQVAVVDISNRLRTPVYPNLNRLMRLLRLPSTDRYLH